VPVTKIGISTYDKDGILLIIGITADQPLELRFAPSGFQKIWINTGTLIPGAARNDLSDASAAAM
jgi:hypothetical protein